MNFIVKELAENYGSLDLLIAYIMRTANVDQERATDIAYRMDMDIERWLEDILYEEEEYEDI